MKEVAKQITEILAKKITDKIERIEAEEAKEAGRWKFQLAIGGYNHSFFIDPPKEWNAEFLEQVGDFIARTHNELRSIYQIVHQTLPNCYRLSILEKRPDKWYGKAYLLDGNVREVSGTKATAIDKISDPVFDPESAKRISDMKYGSEPFGWFEEER